MLLLSVTCFLVILKMRQLKKVVITAVRSVKLRQAVSTPWLCSSRNVSLLSRKSTSIPNLHLQIRNSAGFLQPKLNDAQLKTQKAEKDYTTARYEEKKMLNKLNLMKMELDRLDQIEDPVNEKELAELELKRTTQATKVSNMEAQLNNAMLREEACFRELSEALRQTMEKETFREWNSIVRTLLASLIGCIGGLVGSLWISQQHIDHGVDQLKGVINETSIEALVNGVEKTLTKSQKDYGQLTGALDELNANLSRSNRMASQGANLPAVVKEFDHLRNVVEHMGEHVNNINEKSNAIIETISTQSVDLKKAIDEHLVITTPVSHDTQLELQITDVADKIMGHIDEVITKQQYDDHHLLHNPVNVSNLISEDLQPSSMSRDVHQSYVRQAMLVGIFGSFLYYVLHG